MVKNCFRTTEKRITAYLIFAAFFLFATPAIVSAYVAYSPSSGLAPGDVTSSLILDRTIIADDVNVSSYWDWGGFQTGSSTGGVINLGFGTGSITKGISFGDGDSGIWENSTNNIYIGINGGSQWRINANNLGSTNSGQAGFYRANVSATTPGILARTSDTNTGIGSSANDNLDIITTGINAIHIDASQRIGIGTTTPADLLDVNGTIGIENQNYFKFYEARTNGNNSFQIRAANSMAADVNISWPNADGASGDFLKTDGAGTLSWKGAGSFLESATSTITVTNTTTETNIASTTIGANVLGSDGAATIIVPITNLNVYLGSAANTVKIRIYYGSSSVLCGITNDLTANITGLTGMITGHLIAGGNANSQLLICNVTIGQSHLIKNTVNNPTINTTITSAIAIDTTVANVFKVTYQSYYGTTDDAITTKGFIAQKIK